MVNIGNDWDELLKNEFDEPYYLELRKFLINEYKTHKVYPEMHDIFNALKATPFKDVKVVILGQDPYHGPGQAHGMSFSVRKGVKTPPSLLNIYKEIRSEYGYEIPNHGYLMEWAKEGVLLLNTILTVRAGEPMSHQKMGWERLTDQIIIKLAKREEPMVFMLWGSPAQKKAELLNGTKHLILKTTHPSPLSASRGFMGCGHFKSANAFLKSNDQKEIDWRIKNGD
ncbi:MAG: uracil-DNA glycosylase [Clostridiaceae bacterium]